jgi:hypothetical protein
MTIWVNMTKLGLKLAKADPSPCYPSVIIVLILSKASNTHNYVCFRLYLGSFIILLEPVLDMDKINR